MNLKTEQQKSSNLENKERKEEVEKNFSELETENGRQICQVEAQGISSINLDTYSKIIN